ncbi:hypothetical protein JYU34_003953 [Plutella xylostella]|uniref:Ig-like domain-containing protein n=1 Tax=Plutella xylostella TaxID=51655 RepID=A0ABQ7R1D1_PLUXY|nr:hypothetical protein JYU34_003953 [Plutella xylostella]
MYRLRAGARAGRRGGGKRTIYIPTHEVLNKHDTAPRGDWTRRGDSASTDLRKHARHTYLRTLLTERTSNCYRGPRGVGARCGGTGSPGTVTNFFSQYNQAIKELHQKLADVNISARDFYDETESAGPRQVTPVLAWSGGEQAAGAFDVSWIRHRDLHILTVGGYTYTSDQRFQASHAPLGDDWTLHIKWAQQRDAGVYECQVSTQPVRSYFVTLHVVVPSARILGGPDLHVDMGSTINLTCLIQFSPEPPAYIFWYHEDEQVISYDSARGGVSVVTEKGAATTSYLLVQDAAPSDSGRYSCSPSNAEVASVRVHVLNGERPAAMQTGSAGASSSGRCIAALLALAALHARWRHALLAS